MCAFQVVETNSIREKMALQDEEGFYHFYIKVHDFESKTFGYLLEIKWKDEEVLLLAPSEALEKIKTALLKRESPGHLLWSILQYEYRVLDTMEEKVEHLQNAALHDISREILRNILRVKKTLFAMHRDYIRVRNRIEAFLDEKTQISGMKESLRDINELIYGVEYLIEETTVAIQLVQNTLSQRINKTMNILTVFATIMMPLTLITGIYGMNFKNMPEITWEYGYYYSLLLMLAVALVMLYYFKKKKLL